VPDLGLTKAIGRAVRAGAKGAKVLRPAEAEIAAEGAARAGVRATEPRLAPVATPNIEAPEVPAAADAGPIVTPAPPEASAAATPPAVDIPGAAPATPGLDDIQATDQAERLSWTKLGDWDTDQSHMPNFDTIKTTDDVKAVISDIAEQNKGKITEARRGVITNEQLQGLADDLDVKQDVVAAVLKREDGDVLRPETILAARKVLNSSAVRLKDLADLITSGKATDIEKIQFARQVQFHNEYQAKFMGARAEAGRSLNAFSIPVGGDATQAARISEILNGAGADVERLAHAVKMTDSVAGVTKVVKPGLFIRSARAGMNLLNRVFVNGILSGPTTHAVNSAGNALFQAMNTFELGAAARLGRFLPGTEHVQIGEALANLHGTIGATKDAWRLAWRTLKTGKTLDNVLKYETSAARTLNTLPELDKPYLRRVVSLIDQVIDAPTERAMASEDEFFKTLAYRGALEREALLHVQSQIDAGAITLDDAAKTAREFMENAPEEAQQAAEDWARDTAFQTPLGPIGQPVQLALRRVPVLTLIAPFIRTPINVFKQAAYRSPMAVFSAKFWRDVQAGGRARDLALTRFAIGSATATMIAHWAANGDITGAGPQQPEAKMLWEADGKRPYSVRLNGTWHSYARMEPLASVIGATADTVEILSYLGDDVETMSDEEQQAYNATAAIIAGVMNNTGNKTFLKGIADFTELVNNPKEHTKPWLSQMGASVVPYSAAQRSLRNVQDPYLREAWTLTDKIRDNIPGYSEKLPPRRGLFGELREKNSGSLLGAMSPMPESTQKSDTVVNELQRVMRETRIVPLTMPDKKIEGMRLTAPDYEQLVRISRLQPIFDGQTATLHDKLDETMSSSVYLSAEPAMRAEIIKSVQRQADQAGRQLLEQQDEDFALRIAQYRLRKERIRFGDSP
jgi:hypothetical protein